MLQAELPVSSPDNGFVSDICILTAQDVRCPRVLCIVLATLPSINLVPLRSTKKVLKPFFLFNFPLIISFESNSEMQTQQRALVSSRVLQALGIINNIDSIS